jgi:hypothetical protein
MNMHWSHQTNKLKIKIEHIHPSEFLAIIIGIFVPLVWELLGVYVVFKIIAIKKRMTPMELLRRFRKGLTRESRKTSSIKTEERYSLLKEASKYLQVFVFCLLFSPDSVNAGFEIISKQKPQPETSNDSGKPFTTVKVGVGDEVRLEDVIRILMDAPWKPEFVSKELQALRVSWYSKRSSASEILAQIGRNYGVETYYVESTGKLFVDWSKGLCEAEIKAKKQKRKEIKEWLMMNSQDPSIPKVIWVSKNERVYLC